MAKSKAAAGQRLRGQLPGCRQSTQPQKSELAATERDSLALICCRWV